MMAAGFYQADFRTDPIIILPYHCLCTHWGFPSPSPCHHPESHSSFDIGELRESSSPSQ